SSKTGGWPLWVDCCQPRLRPPRSAIDHACTVLAAADSQVRTGLPAGGKWIRTDGPAREKLPSGAPVGFPARLYQLGEALIRRGTKSSNPASSISESRELRELLGRSGRGVERPRYDPR